MNELVKLWHDVYVASIRHGSTAGEAETKARHAVEAMVSASGRGLFGPEIKKAANG